MKKIMPWIDVLPNVEATNFQARRDEIEAIAMRAQQPSSDTVHLLGEAYFQACKLEGDAKAHWSLKEVEQAKRCTG